MQVRWFVPGELRVAYFLLRCFSQARYTHINQVKADISYSSFASVIFATGGFNLRVSTQ